jgi:hypothetical protein
LCGGERSDAWLIEQLRCEGAGELFDLARELALFDGQRACQRTQLVPERAKPDG